MFLILYLAFFFFFFFKDNRRYYKVKWMKITWEAEDDIAYFSNIIEDFWTEYAKECLLQEGNETVR